jgi:hypothetical protein
MTSPRTKELLQGIIGTLRNGECLDGKFLNDYNVTASECDIFGVVADVLAGFLASPPAEQIRLRLLGAGEPEHLVNFIVDHIKADAARGNAIEALGEWVANVNAKAAQQ